MTSSFQDEVLRLPQFRNDSRSSTPFTYDSDGSTGPAAIAPEHLAEWQWPPGSGDHFMLQDQVNDYLETRNLHRKHPNIRRHAIMAEERKHLEEEDIITGEQIGSFCCFAVSSEDVLDIMEVEYPVKYRALLVYLQEKQFYETLKGVLEGDEAERAAESGEGDEKAEGGTEREDIDSHLRDVLVDNAVDFNKRLRKSYGEPGRKYVCTQTNKVHIPQNEQYIAPPEFTKRGKYPVAVLPGQYTDSYPEYSPEELHCLPLNTRLLHRSPTTPPSPIGSPTADPSPTLPCKYCFSPIHQNQVALNCNTCTKYFHVRCVGVKTNIISNVMKYTWQCPTCKTCSVCDQPDQAESLLLCDKCDRGYHTTCIGLSDIPDGTWQCRECACCGSCGSKEPGSKTWRFVHDTRSGTFLTVLCTDCSDWWDKSWFCPVCLKVYDYDAVDNPMVCCDLCDRWIHTVCDNIDDEHYNMLSKSGDMYKCVLCRGEKEEIYDIHHKKYEEQGDDKENVV